MGGLRTWISFTGMEYSLFLLCVLSIASVPIASYSVASSSYAVLPVALTIVHFDGTLIYSLHTM